ncbi:MAG TPA: hypothetical protein VJ770_24435 [Stellaceae bacterium]|nr:hypothetical protein [Stellaceae bacterium]
MNSIDPDHLAQLVQELHGYALDSTGAARAAAMVSGIAAALAALIVEPQFHEEPAGFAATLAALAPEER